MLPMSFTTTPSPTSPQRMAFAPIAISTGISSSCSSGGRRVMNSSVPLARRPIFDPGHRRLEHVGAFRLRAPRAMRRDRLGEMVEDSM